MSYRRLATFESLENRRALAVTATGSAGGDLIVSGDADGAVEIVAVSEGAYRVTDNGVVIADADVLTGVTDDIRINLDKTAGVDNTVTVNLGSNVVDTVYARLGAGSNSLTHNGQVDGDLNVVSANEEDTVTVAETAIVGGATKLGLGEQQDFFGRCRNGGGGGFGMFGVGGRAMGFFYRGFQR